MKSAPLGPGPTGSQGTMIGSTAPSKRDAAGSCVNTRKGRCTGSSYLRRYGVGRAGARMPSPSSNSFATLGSQTAAEIRRPRFEELQALTFPIEVDARSRCARRFGRARRENGPAFEPLGQSHQARCLRPPEPADLRRDLSGERFVGRALGDRFDQSCGDRLRGMTLAVRLVRKLIVKARGVVDHTR